VIQKSRIQASAGLNIDRATVANHLHGLKKYNPDLSEDRGANLEVYVEKASSLGLFDERDCQCVWFKKRKKRINTTFDRCAQSVFGLSMIDQFTYFF